ncbi:MAG: hypothetical protein QG635_1166 [Bacteroidota bacterium]|nr:hypothetical protein [Bacteroidota bacterium]
MNNTIKQRLAGALLIMLALVICAGNMQAQYPKNNFEAMAYYQKDEGKLYVEWYVNVEPLKPNYFQIWLAKGTYKQINDSGTTFTQIAELHDGDYVGDRIRYHAVIDIQLDDGDYTLFVKMTVDNGTTFENSSPAWFSVFDYKPHDKIIFSNYPPDKAAIGNLYSFDLDAYYISDSTKEINFKLMDAPADMTIDTYTGEIDWTPAVKNIYYIWVQAYLAEDSSVFSDLYFAVNVGACLNLGKIIGTIVTEKGRLADGFLSAVQMDSTGSGSKLYYAPVNDGKCELKVDEGSYYLLFEDIYGVQYFFPGTPDYKNAQLVNIQCGETFNFNMTIPDTLNQTLYNVSGYVTDENGNPIMGAMVTFEGVYLKHGNYKREFMYSITTDTAGFYSIQIPDYFKYRAYALDIYGNGSYMPLYYNQTYNYYDAEIIDLTGDRSDINFQFSKLPDNPGTITSQVQNEDGDVLPGSFVIAFQIDGLLDGRDTDSRASIADDHGNFKFEGLKYGAYIFFALPQDINYAPGFYKEGDVAVWDWADATQVNIKDNTQDITITLPKMKARKGICRLSGYIKTSVKKIKFESGDALTDASIYLSEENGNAVSYVKSDLEGRFDMESLASGFYTLSVDKVGYKHFSTTIELKDNQPLDGFGIDMVPDEAVSVDDTQYNSNKAAAFPNPANQSATVKFDGTSGSASISVISITGESIYLENIQTIDGENSLNIETAKMAAGWYFVKISNGESVLVLPLVVAH